MIPTLASAPQDLQSLKLYLLDLTGLGKDALHVYAGLTVFITIRLVWRWRGGWIVAWLASLALALGIEWLDIRAEGQIGVPQPDPAHWHDVWNTMVWPTILLLVGRWLQPRPKPNAETSGDLSDQSFEEPPPV
jgi:hypothetical protein